MTTRQYATVPKTSMIQPLLPAPLTSDERGRDIKEMPSPIPRFDFGQLAKAAGWVECARAPIGGGDVADHPI
ncbi:hypothetical protein E4U16_006615 [Claviceps sp. LM84 group G4]|nr:hypothetical protein E4U16_006615 [Claviceps sp. LM84 group G4]